MKKQTDIAGKKYQMLDKIFGSSNNDKNVNESLNKNEAHAKTLAKKQKK